MEIGNDGFAHRGSGMGSSLMLRGGGDGVTDRDVLREVPTENFHSVLLTKLRMAVMIVLRLKRVARFYCLSSKLFMSHNKILFTMLSKNSYLGTLKPM